MQNVMRLADQYFDRHHPDALDRHERLFACVALVAVFHLIASIAFAKLQEIEKRHHVFHPGPSITYDMMIAPPVVRVKPAPPPVVPPPTALEQGKVDIGGKASAAKHSEKVEIVTDPPKVQAQDEHRELPQAQPMAQLIATKPVTEEHGSTTQDWHGGTGDQHGDGGIGAGAGGTVGGGTAIDNAGGETLPPARMVQTEKRDIAPYRSALLMKLAEVWRPKKDDGIVLLVRIAKDGTIVEASAEQFTTDKAAERVTKALQKVQFDPLPDWYRGKDMLFRLTMGAPVE